jgi:glycosyltransferase involved in cell wall biosynthesis
MTQPLVSVGMPCYDRPESLKKAIESILSQTYKNIEFVISEDPSPNPEIPKMLDEYAAKDSRIKLWHQPVDLQCYGNYYFVQQQATGKYFMYAQDDDLWEPDFIESLVGCLERHPECAFAIPKSEYIVDGKSWQVFTFNRQSRFEFVFGEKPPFVWMAMWRTDKIREFDRDALNIHGKDIIIAAEALFSYPFCYVDKLLYHKTLYHDKAGKYIRDKPWCHFEMYYNLIKRVITSKHVKDKSVVILLIPLAGVAILRLYSAQLLFMLPINHPVRKFVRTLIRKV